ncbi:MAG: response regulator transcription factor, partial [Actinobacteria bacterium]|nr:response regulator transcription factor [Actinomycetota bacterium]
MDDPLIGVLIVDDHDMVARALADALDDGVNCSIVGIAHTRSEAEALLVAHPVDVVVLDLRLADGDDTTSFIPEILLTSPDTKVLVLSAWGDDWSVSRAVEMGCHGYMLKEQGLDELTDGI